MNAADPTPATNFRRCQTCGITALGSFTDRALVSPSGVVHLTGHAGTTFCGKTPTPKWRAVFR